MTVSNAIPALHARRQNSSERYFNSEGRINAGSKREVLQTLASLYADVQSGAVSLADDDESGPQGAHERKEKALASLVEAYHDKSANSGFLTIGSTIGASIITEANRQGFMRTLLMRGAVAQGALPRIRKVVKQTNVIVATGPTMVTPHYVRNDYYQPPEFYIIGETMIPQLELVQGTTDIIDETYQQALESIMVTEDRIVKQGFDMSVGLVNSAVSAFGTLTPTSLLVARDQIIGRGLMPTRLLMSADFLSDFAADTSFANLYSEVDKFELIRTGQIGQVYNMTLMTDAHRTSTLRVLNPGEMYVMTNPENLGVYTERGPVQVVELDESNRQIPGRGWRFTEMVSITPVINPAGIVRLTRVS